MTLQEYEQAFDQTTDTIPWSFTRVANAALGMGMEVGDIQRLVVNEIRGREPGFDSQVVKEKLGDLFWYMMYLTRTLNLDMGEILAKNIEKQSIMYPGGFSVPEPVREP